MNNSFFGLFWGLFKSRLTDPINQESWGELSLVLKERERIFFNPLGGPSYYRISIHRGSTSNGCTYCNEVTTALTFQKSEPQKCLLLPTCHLKCPENVGATNLEGNQGMLRSRIRTHLKHYLGIALDGNIMKKSTEGNMAGNYRFRYMNFSYEFSAFIYDEEI